MDLKHLNWYFTQTEKQRNKKVCIISFLYVAYQCTFAYFDFVRPLMLRLYSLLLVHSPPALAVVTSSHIVPSRDFDVAVSAVAGAAAIIVSSLFRTLPFPVPIVN